jgi:cobaltochelatase CobT
MAGKLQEPRPADLFGLARLRAALLKLAGTDDPAEADAIESAPAPVAEPAPAPTPAADRVPDPAGYFAYTTVFDEILRPEQIADRAELEALHAELQGEIERLAMTHAGWLRPWAQKIAARAQEQRVLVTLLLDNSGSLRGERIRTIAAWSALLSEILDRAGAIVEVLGFTTVEWRGGRTHQLWVSDGSPEPPGRLNDLRHIIYKAHDDAEPAANFALMLKEGLLKENIDGEALLWAAERQSAIDAAEKILVIMSDGAPVDDSTLGANHADFLHDHLLETARAIEREGRCTLFGLYLEGDYRPFAYYGRSAVIKAPEQMGLAILKFLAIGRS